MKIHILWTFILLLLPLSLLSAQEGAIQNGSAIIAEVNGTPVTLGQLDQERAENLFQPKRTYYEAERKALDDLIDQRLLEMQAQRENVTVEQLLERHVNSQIKKDPTDDQLEVFYESLGTDQPLAAIRGEILRQLREIRISKARTAYLKQLRSEAKVSVMLSEPRVQIAWDGKDVRGPRNAPVRVIEFADYQCPYCRQLEPTLERLHSEFGDKVAIAFMDYPLPGHAHAPKMAEAADCAGAQGKFWEYHDFLFNDLKEPFETAALKEHARALGLDAAKFDSCLDSNGQSAEINKDMAEAKRLAIAGTPTLFVNGRFATGAVKYETLRDMVQEELAAATPPQTHESEQR